MSAARIAPVLKSRLATSATTFQAVRSISSTASLSKGPVETAKDTLKKADQAVSSAAVKGIDKGGMFSITPIQLLELVAKSNRWI